VIQLFVESHDVDPDPPTPIMEIGPRQFALHRPIHSHQAIASLLKRQLLQTRVSTGQFLLEKEIVEMPVQQRAVHIKQHVVNFIPIDPVRRREGDVRYHKESIKDGPDKDETLCFRNFL
jgi:hypothetical protein